MVFIVTVKGDRFSGNYGANTASEDVSKAAEYADVGEVTITDPQVEEWKPEHFHLMLERWAKRG